MIKVFRVARTEKEKIPQSDNYSLDQKTISMDTRKLKLLRISEDNPSQVEFRYTDQAQNLSVPVNFNLRYYKAFQGWFNITETKQRQKDYEEARR